MKTKTKKIFAICEMIFGILGGYGCYIAALMINNLDDGSIPSKVALVIIIDIVGILMSIILAAKGYCEYK